MAVRAAGACDASHTRAHTRRTIDCHAPIRNAASSCRSRTTSGFGGYLLRTQRNKYECTYPNRPEATARVSRDRRFEAADANAVSQKETRFGKLRGGCCDFFQQNHQRNEKVTLGPAELGNYRYIRSTSEHCGFFGIPSKRCAPIEFPCHRRRHAQSMPRPRRFLPVCTSISIGCFRVAARSGRFSPIPGSRSAVAPISPRFSRRCTGIEMLRGRSTRDLVGFRARAHGDP